jgi:uncharacterized repeat protein (TIGR02543 family)
MSAFGSGPSNGQFWYGNSTNFPGFLYKKNVGVGGRRSTKMGPGGNITCNSATDLYNKYKPGTGGVGASSIANRRAKNRLATICGSSNKCFPCYNTLGQYSNYTHNPNGFVPCPGTINIISSSGSVTPTPTPTPSTTYNLLYRTLSGSGTPPPTTAYSGGTNVTILGQGGFTNGSNTFGGWNTAFDGTGIYYPQGSNLTMPYANTTLWAQWYNPAGTNYQVIYDGNTSTSGTAPATVNYKSGQGVGISDNTGSLAKTGSTFYGWNTSANGSGTAYPVTSNGFTMPASNVTLYAQWVNTSTNFTLTYDGNGSTGGSVPATPTSYPSGAGVSVLGQSSLVKSGYIFLGWNTASDGTGINYPIGNSIVMNSNKSLYAQWVGGSVAKSCGTGTGGSTTANIYNSGSRTVYRDTTNNTITIIIPTYFSTTNGGPYGTGDGPNASPPSTSYGNILSTYATAIISESSPGSYQISVTYTTIWTGGSQVQTATLPLSPTYWPVGQTISGITIPTGGAQPASFIFDTTATPSFTVPAGCFSSVTTSGSATVNATFAGIIAFYINFTDGTTTTRVAVGTEFRWVTQNAPPRTYTYTSNYARIEVATGTTPSPITGTFTPFPGATTSVNSA